MNPIKLQLTLGPHKNMNVNRLEDYKTRFYIEGFHTVIEEGVGELEKKTPMQKIDPANTLFMRDIAQDVNIILLLQEYRITIWLVHIEITE